MNTACRMYSCEIHLKSYQATQVMYDYEAMDLPRPSSRLPPLIGN